MHHYFGIGYCVKTATGKRGLTVVDCARKALFERLLVLGFCDRNYETMIQIVNLQIFYILSIMA